MENVTIELVISLFALIAAFYSIYRNNRNNKLQIKVSKLEELFEVIKSLGGSYYLMAGTTYQTKAYQNPQDKTINSLKEYWMERDELLPREERDKIVKYVSRLDVLTECYTRGKLNKKIRSYHEMLVAISNYTFNGGDIIYESKFGADFVETEKYRSDTKEILDEIIKEIKV
ncbi:hypothetical protein [Labilibaculum antarcticum]|uniref:Uncharacterized protein n=1 Tax=Labilibaculum antarcticum TaxID=1717717 RepID=A0A1Y1CKP1_9BACT|nr:hypothetical protein [Labilibaculum antarcticum]BAX80978.1 hypothetical protein ALGA_2665 [Labilibaculum antarcticum]